MSLSTMQVEPGRVPKHQPFSLYLEDALKTLNYDHTPRTIPRRYCKHVNTKKHTDLCNKQHVERGKVHKNVPPDRGTVRSKLPPDWSTVTTKLSPGGGIVGVNTMPERGMVGVKVIKGRVSSVNREKEIVSERLKTGREYYSRKTSKNAQPLGKLREYSTDNYKDHIPKLKNVDTQHQKEKQMQKILESLNLSQPSKSHQRNPASSSSKKEPFIKNTTGIDFASSLLESHNLTLKQLREFWKEMPSFLNIQAAKLRRKYGINEGEFADDIDDISIEIVTKWNKPTVVFPEIEHQHSRSLYVVMEEK